ncbi:MAG: hypothetical protein ACOX5Z_00155 [Desulfobulbus sp.]|jgi:hypothetical protein
MTRRARTLLAVLRHAAAVGYDYSPRHGVSCPWCGHRTVVYATLPWADDVRIRYHRCTQAVCPVARLGISIKSIQVEPD